MKKALKVKVIIAFVTAALLAVTAAYFFAMHNGLAPVFFYVSLANFAIGSFWLVIYLRKFPQS